MFSLVGFPTCSLESQVFVILFIPTDVSNFGRVIHQSLFERRCYSVGTRVIKTPLYMLNDELFHLYLNGMT